VGASILDWLVREVHEGVTLHNRKEKKQAMHIIWGKTTADKRTKTDRKMGDMDKQFSRE